MESQVYKDMLDVMTKRGGPLAGMDIPEFYALVQELFTPEEAELNNALPRNPVTAAEIAKEKGKNEAEVTALLEGMANKGLCVAFHSEGKTYYQAAAFMPGIFEFQFMGGRATGREKKIAQAHPRVQAGLQRRQRAPANFLPIEPRHLRGSEDQRAERRAHV